MVGVVVVEVVGTQTESSVAASNFVAVAEVEIEHLENLPSCLDFAAAFVEGEYLHVVVAVETAETAVVVVVVVEKTVVAVAAFAYFVA